MAGRRVDDHLPAGGPRQLFVVPDYSKGIEGWPSPTKSCTLGGSTSRPLKKSLASGLVV
jgi:hypothetical protein